MKIVDLHVHSSRSDGTLTPKELVDYAMKKELAAFALTDHDTIAGLEEAVTYSETLRKRGLNAPEVIPGIELSTEHQGRDIHIMGLFLDYKNTAFQKKLEAFIDSRTIRNHKMCALLRACGIDIMYDKLLETFPNAVITRAHYASYMLQHGYINSNQEAFDRYIGDDCPCFIPREKVTPVQAIQLILEAGGLPILAHPMLYHMSNMELTRLVRELKEEGLAGIEALYSTHTPVQERQLRKLAGKYNLLLSGGSDYHGSNKPDLDLATGYGSLVIPLDVLTTLRKSRSRILFSDMDGTLLNNDGACSPAMKAGLDRLTANGHHLVLSSGRPLPSILETTAKLNLDYPNMMIIANNGSLVYDCTLACPVSEHRILHDDIRYIVQEADKRGIHIHAFTDTEIVCRCQTDELRYYTRKILLPVKYVDDIPSALEKGSYKLQIIHLTDRNKLIEFRDAVAPYCRERLQFLFSCERYLEVLPAASGKGSALTFVRDYLQIPASRTYAAGDAENDLSMLAAAHTAIAMKNAPRDVQDAADFITAKDNNEDGLLEMIDTFFT